MSDLPQPKGNKVVLGELAMFVSDNEDDEPEAGVSFKLKDMAQLDSVFHLMMLNAWIDCMLEVQKELKNDIDWITNHAKKGEENASNC